ncbi:hypothetical protein ACFWF9_12510 [Streptomyces roseolus]|uniref:hypothetical protein n=1 Tax=Streptomyces roseolus TaxID=67358 RepID=UPI00365B8E9B
MEGLSPAVADLVVLHLRELLAADGLEAFAKTSGKEGLPLLVPRRRHRPRRLRAGHLGGGRGLRRP